MQKYRRFLNYLHFRDGSTSGEDVVNNLENIFVEPPSINEDDVSGRNLTVIAGRSKVIDCPARGVPAPEIVWYKVKPIRLIVILKNEFYVYN